MPLKILFLGMATGLHFLDQHITSGGSICIMGALVDPWFKEHQWTAQFGQFAGNLRYQATSNGKFLLLEILATHPPLK
jgi:hypothetical protein